MSYIVYNPETKQYVGTIATITTDIATAFRFATREQAETALLADEVVQDYDKPPTKAQIIQAQAIPREVSAPRKTTKRAN
ncbi:MAG: hypothetical protein ACRDFB_04505, partial [Rhabdochlamydiaceae bacterium]